MAVQGVQGWWFKEFWFEEQYTDLSETKRKRRSIGKKRKYKENDENRSKEEKKMKVKIGY